MKISISSPAIDLEKEIVALSDRIFLELLKDSDPVEGIMRLYDEAVNKRDFVMAMAAALLLRHRQWQCASIR